MKFLTYIKAPNTKKGISEVIKGTVENVYPENIGEVAYQASFFRSNDSFGEVVESELN